MSTKRRRGAPDLVSAWPDVRRVLLRSLRRQVGRDTAEDICQDVAERLVARRVPFATVEDLLKWAQRVASNRAIDEWRTYTRRVSVESVPDHESPIDVARRAAHRVAIDETAAAIRSLRPEERDALLRADSPNAVDGRDARERQRDANLRERARKRLRGMVHNFPAGLGMRLGNWLRRWPSPSADVAAADWGHLLAGAGIAIALLAGPLGGDGLPGGASLPAGDEIAAVSRSAGHAAPAFASADAAGHGAAERATASSPSAGTGATSSAASSRVVLQAVETPVSRTAVGTDDNDPDDPDQGTLCAGSNDGSFRFCADDALAGVPLPPF